jgi:hypothetical protein
MAKRPRLEPALKALVAFVQSHDEAFTHLSSTEILFVAGEARRASRATIKPLRFARGRRTDGLGRRKPLVVCHGTAMRYVITLRPLFFRRSTPRARVATVLHELFHVSDSFDGSLHPQRRHEAAGDGFEAAFTPIERRVWKMLPQALVAPFAHDGEVWVPMWLERPPAWLRPGQGRVRYTEADVFDGVVRMKTAKSQRPT